MEAEAMTEVLPEIEQVPSWDEAHRQTIDYLQDPCPCGHKRHTHGQGGCWVSSCNCDVPVWAIARRGGQITSCAQ